MDMSVISWFWTITTGLFVLVGLGHRIYRFLPTIARDAIVYGKLQDKTQRSGALQLLLVPKRWFLHFYVLSFVWNGMTLAITLRFVLQGNPFPAWYMRALEALTNYPISTPRVDLLSITIAITVIVVHAFRRILECVFVSVYSKSNMHVAHYLAGIFFYSLQGFSIIGEGPQVHSEGVPHTLSEMMKNLRVNHIVGVLVFLWASFHHHRAHEIFASLRSTAKDVNRHMIPRGDWFEYVSCPHYLAEILIYLSLGLILGPAQQTWWLVLAFVVSNQTAASLEVHRWYLAKFEDYPKDRKAFIPFIL